jgi:anti-anti-sigma factor
MGISLRFERSIPVVTLAGRLDARGAGELDETLREVKGAWVVLDFAAVQYLSSMGIRSLVVAGQALRKNSGIVPLETEDDFARMLEFEQGLEAVASLEDAPQNRYRGRHRAELEKAHAVICRLRRHANTVTLFETDMVPYWLAALEWTYPIVCWDESLLRKKLTLYSAALVVKRILESQARAAGA